MITHILCPSLFFVQVPIALYGFVIAATWIDTIADRLVALLEFLGIILRM
jgi:sodium/potassium/calcium exchanger 6